MSWGCEIEAYWNPPSNEVEVTKVAGNDSSSCSNFFYFDEI